MQCVFQYVAVCVTAYFPFFFFNQSYLALSESHSARTEGVLQCVAVPSSVLQCVAVCCSVLQCVAVLIH